MSKMKKILFFCLLGYIASAQESVVLNTANRAVRNNNNSIKDELLNLTEKSKKNKAIAVSISAKCFVDNKDGKYIAQNDLDGEQINAFNTETLRENPRYGVIDKYKEGFARISKDQVYGFLNLCGEEAITAQYDYAEPFNGGKALVKKFFWFFVDANGNESEQLQSVVDAKAIKFGVSLVKFKNGKSAFISNDFDKSLTPISEFYDEIVPFSENIFQVRNGKTFGLIKIDGSKKTELIYDRISQSTVNDWALVVEKGKIGMQSLSKDTYIKPNYDNVNGFYYKNQTFFNAQNAEGTTLYDITNNRKSNTYKTIEPFNDQGVAIVQNEARAFGLIDSELNILIQPIYKSFSPFDKMVDLAEVSKEDAAGKRTYGFVDMKGLEIIPVKYDKVSPFSKYGFAVASDKQNDFVYEYRGKICLGKPDANNRYAVTDTVYSNRYVLIKTVETKPDKSLVPGLNLIDRKQLKPLTPQTFTSLKRVDDTFFAIETDTKWGIMDTTGNITIKPLYKEIKFLSEGVFSVKYDNNKYGFISKTGKVQVSFEYNDVQPFSSGLAIVDKGPNKVGVINKFNAKVVPCVFASIKKENNVYTIVDKAGTTFGLDNQGNCTVNCQEFYKVLKRENDK